MRMAKEGVTLAERLAHLDPRTEKQEEAEAEPSVSETATERERRERKTHLR